MKAMVLNRTTSLKENSNPLELTDIPVPDPKEREILIKVSCCGVCHTELDEIEGRTPPSQFPMIPGHQVIGRVEKRGTWASKFQTGDRVGAGWIYRSCGACHFCRTGQDNLCAEFKATGRDANGGYAEYMVIHEDYAVSIPKVFSDEEAAPLLCAGSIGYRSLKLSGLQNGSILGLTGFGASAHLVLKLVRHQFPETKIYVFARHPKEREYALGLGASWAGDTAETSPEPCSAIIDTTPVWKPVVEALRNLEPGGRLVINAIRKEDIDREYLLTLNYQSHLWMEKEIKSVANVSRNDIRDFLKIAGRIPIRPEVETYPFTEANFALGELKEGKIRGAKVLRID